jgi:ketosteroid isomerase-like protein
MPTEKRVRAFIDAINARDPVAIVGLCSADHQFVDAHGAATPAEQLRSAWAGYFRFMPRYRIEVETILADGDTAAIFGWAWGSLDAEGSVERSWRRPCAWRARVTDGQIALWQVYVDTKAVFDLL